MNITVNTISLFFLSPSVITSINEKERCLEGDGVKEERQKPVESDGGQVDVAAF